MGNCWSMDDPNFTDDTFFRIPVEYLTEEQVKKQEQFIIDFEADLLNTEQQTKPTAREKTVSLELSLSSNLFKLAEKTFAYSILIDAIRKGESEKVGKIIIHNLNMFERVIKKSVGGAIAVLKTSSFITTHEVQVQTTVNPYAFGTLFMKMGEIDRKLQKEQAINPPGQSAHDAQDGYVQYEIKESFEQTLKPGGDGPENTNEYFNNSKTCEKNSKEDDSETTDGDDFQVDHNEQSNDPVHPDQVEANSEDLNTTDKGAEGKKTEVNVEPISPEITPESNSLQFDSELEKIMGGLIREEMKIPVETSKEDKHKAEIDKREFEMMMKAHAEKNKKEQDEINMVLDKENDRLDSLIRKQINEAEETFRKLKEMEERMDKESKERSEEREEEFRRKMEEQKRKQEEFIRKMREEREEMEREMDRIHEENLKKLYMQQQVFWNCVELKLKWEEKENEWTDFLKRLRTSVSRTKIQYMKFERETRNYSKDNAFEKMLIEFELETLRRKTLQSYELLYQSFTFLKNLENKFPDRVFILILLDNLKNVADSVCTAAMRIDEVRENLDNRLSLKEIFGALDSHQILQTWNLRELSKTARMEDYENIDDPSLYEFKSSGGPKIEEVVEEEQNVNDTPTNSDEPSTTQTSSQSEFHFENTESKMDDSNITDVPANEATTTLNHEPHQTFL